MRSPREDILAAIRRVLPDTEMRQSDYAAIIRDYSIRGQRGETARTELFEHRLIDYNAGVYRCNQNEVAEAIAHVMHARQKQQLAVPAGVLRQWLPCKYSFVDGGSLNYEELDRCDGVLTGCALAIATTGTIVLRHSDVEGRRDLTLIPDYHVCVVLSSQIVETVPEGMRQIAQFGSNPITMISGPSATSDIEMIRVKGVHGPRVLDVIIAAG
jgi:L-lactate dehydrogenase complex protein LldG